MVLSQPRDRHRYGEFDGKQYSSNALNRRHRPLVEFIAFRRVSVDETCGNFGGFCTRTFILMFGVLRWSEEARSAFTSR